jgi:hypothetical protein
MWFGESSPIFLRHLLTADFTDAGGSKFKDTVGQRGLFPCGSKYKDTIGQRGLFPFGSDQGSVVVTNL